MEKYNKFLCSSELRNIQHVKVACVKTKQRTAFLELLQRDIPSLNTQVNLSVHVLWYNNKNKTYYVTKKIKK